MAKRSANFYKKSVAFVCVFLMALLTMTPTIIQASALESVEVAIVESNESEESTKQLQGSGTEGSPWKIESAADIVLMAQQINSDSAYADDYYIMTSDIDLSGVEFNGIPSTNAFSGVFDGDGHVFYNVNISNGLNQYTGVFQRVDGGTVKNLGVENGMISGGKYVGMIGAANNATILNCYNGATVRGSNDVGGLVGMMTNSTLSNSFNKGLIRITVKSVGGLCGSASKSTISNCYNIGQVNVGTYTGKIIGYTTTTMTFENVYYDSEAAIKNQPIGTFQKFDGIVALTNAELASTGLVSKLNANLKEGYMSWSYGKDKIARLSVFEENAKISAFIASVDKVSIKDGKIEPLISEDGAYKTVVYGSDHKSIIDLEGNVYQPLVAKNVLLILDVVEIATGDVVGRVNRNIEVTVEGKHADSGVNSVPNVMPGLREWYGLSGDFEITDNTRIVFANGEMQDMAIRIQTYLADMLHIELEVISGEGTEGDIILRYTPDRYGELQDEGYYVAIDNKIVIESPTEIGMLYAAISIMQIMQQSENGISVPKGYIRDYPQYEVRGGHLHVGPLYFQIDYLEEIAKYMSWYKLNTLEVDLGSRQGDFGAAFPLESKKYPALNSTMGDYVWTQDEYRQMQKDLKEFGINVITLINSPGHSQFYEPIDTNNIISSGSFNLTQYYDESLALVKSVFDEFLDGEDPVIQSAVVHIGTDESNNTKENMRRYIGDLSQYLLAKDNVEKVAFWGNLSLYYGETEIVPENVITQLWDSPDYRVDEALEEGFEIINSNSNMLYLVPFKTHAFGMGNQFAGWTDMALFYDTWNGASDFDTHNLANPSDLTSNGNYYAEHDILKGNPQILGSIFCEWNTGVGHSYDIAELIVPYIAVVAEKCWYGDTNRFENGDAFAEAFGKVDDYAAYANPRYRVDSDNSVIASYDFDLLVENKAADNVNGYDALITNGSIVNVQGSNVLSLNGSTSVQLPFSGVGYPFTASLELYLDGEQGENVILFSNDICTIYLNYEDMGVCFRANNYIYSFNVEIPTDEWVNIMITSQSPKWVDSEENITILKINGVPYTPVNTTNRIYKSRSTVLGTDEMFTGIKGCVDNLAISNSYLADPIFETYKFEGAGTESNPYLIKTAKDLQMFACFVSGNRFVDSYFKLTSDIDMTGIYYTPAYVFSGTLDGNGYKITNLNVSMPDAENVGLVGFLKGGTVKNLGIESGSINGSIDVGAIAGETLNAVIINCYSKATITGTRRTGGLVGSLNSSQMYNCYSAGTVNGSNGVGGIAGVMQSSLNLSNPAVMDNVYSISSVSGSKNVGGLIGYDEGTSTTVEMTNVYYYGSLSFTGNNANRIATLLTEAQLTDGTLLGWLNANVKEGYTFWEKGEDGLPQIHVHIEVTDAAVAATCTTDGLTEGKHCSVCNAVLVAQTVVEALGHTEVIDAAVAPTCTANGLTEGKHCSVCNKVLVAQEEIEAIGHEWLNASTENPKTCKNCGATEGEKLPSVSEDPIAPENSNEDKSPEANLNFFQKIWLAIINFFKKLFKI